MQSSPNFVWILHQNCTSNCPHCFWRPVPTSTNDEIRELIDSVRSHGCTAGLQLADQHSPDALELMVETGFIDQVEEEGRKVIELKDSLPEQDWLEKMVEKDVTFVFSLHGHDPETHKLISHSADFSHTFAGIKEAQRRGLRVFLNTVVHKGNCRSVVEICDLAADNGVKRIRFLRLQPSPRAMQHLSNLFMDTPDVFDFFEHFNRAREKHYGNLEIEMISPTFGPYYSRLEYLIARVLSMLKGSKQGFFCDCGSRTVCLIPKTRQIYPCRFIVADPRFAIGYWDDEKGVVIDKPTWFDGFEENIKEPCRSCKILKQCGGYCRAQAISNHYWRTGELDFHAGVHGCTVPQGVYRPLLASDYWDIFKKIFRRIGGIIKQKNG